MLVFWFSKSVWNLSPSMNVKYSRNSHCYWLSTVKCICECVCINNRNKDRDMVANCNSFPPTFSPPLTTVLFIIKEDVKLIVFSVQWHCLKHGAGACLSTMHRISSFSSKQLSLNTRDIVKVCTEITSFTVTQHHTSLRKMFERTAQRTRAFHTSMEKAF